MRATMSLAVAFVLATVGRGLAEDEKSPDYSKKSIAKWIVALKDQDNPNSAVVARQALGPNGPYAKTAISALIDALDEKEEAARLELVAVLADYGVAAEPSLVRALKRPEALVRVGALYALGGLSQESNEAVTAIIGTLKDPIPEVRIAAALCLNGVGGHSDKAVPALVVALQDKNDRVRAAILQSLSKMGSKAEPAVPALISELKDKEKHVRDEAAWTLMKVGPAAKAAIPALIEALQNKKEPVDRVRIAQALGAIGSAAKEAVPALVKALEDPDDELLQRWAAIALGGIGPNAKGAVPKLIKLAENNKNSLQGDAINALGMIGPDAKAAVPILINQLDNHKYLFFEMNVADALGGIGHEAKAALPALLALARNLRTDSQLRKAAALAVIKIDPEIAAKENMELAYLNVRLGKAPSVKLAPRPDLTKEKKKVIKALIAKLAEIKDPDFGMSATLTGHAFAPLPDQEHWGMGLLTDHGTKTSDVFRSLVEIGPDALPFLLEALEDKTPTRLRVGHNSGPIGFMGFGTELHGNPLNSIERRVLLDETTHENDEHGSPPDQYTVKVGDVCFVAIGQIVGRSYQAVRYQPTAIVVINSPVEKRILRSRVRAIWSSKDPAKKLLDSLLIDYSTEGVFNGKSLDGWYEGSNRQIQATMRLLYYFPKETIPLIAQRLKSFDVRDADADDWMKREVRNGVRTLDFIKAVSWCQASEIQEELTDIYKRTHDAEIKKILQAGRK
ncbi:MAG: HEAT repeat domain-containing protein [Gemmataceae bacterium]